MKTKKKHGWVILLQNLVEGYRKKEFYTQDRTFKYAGPLRAAKVYLTRAGARGAAQLTTGIIYNESVRKVALNTEGQPIKIIGRG